MSTRGLRILHVAQPVDGGVAEVVGSLIPDQLARGWDVHVACSDDSTLFSGALTHGAKVHAWNATRSPDHGTFAQAVALRRIIRKVRPDVLHLHSSKAGLAGRLTVRGRIPTIFMPHMWSFAAQGGFVVKAARHWEIFAARWTTKFLCVSEDEADVGRAAGIDREMDVVENGVDLDKFVPMDEASAREQLGLCGGPFAVCVGRIAPQKGQDLLLEAWPAVVSRVEGARLVIVGAGPFEDEIRQRLSSIADDPTVIWVGPTEDPRLYYAASRVVVLPSRSEGMALVPLEALAMARPVVAFDVSGARRSIGNAGAVVPTGDVDALGFEIGRRLTDTELASSEGRAGRHRAESHFDLRANLELIARLTSTVSERTGAA